jgi:hypothetical protein
MKPTIIEFDPSNGKATVKTSMLPSGRIMATAAYLAPYAYIFGGQDMEGIRDQIIRYDPATDNVEVMQVSLPEVRMGSSAVAVGDSIYIIGGRNETGHVDTVFRFTPGNGTVLEVARMPAPGGGRATVYDGKRVLLFGGCAVSCASGEIDEFDPVAMEARRMAVKMPYGVYWTTGVWTGDSALVFGGNDFTKPRDDIVMYSPGEVDGATEIVGQFPKPLELAVSFWDGSRAYVLGGRSTLEGSDDIFVITKAKDKPEPGPIPVHSGMLTVGAIMISLIICVPKKRKRSKHGSKRS